MILVKQGNFFCMRDMKLGKLWLSQEDYIEHVLKRFNMDKAESVSTQLASHFKLSEKLCTSSVEENEYMERVPYDLFVW